MTKTLGADDDKQQIRKLVLQILRLNALWNFYLVCSYPIITNTSRRWTDARDTALLVILTVIMLICVVFIAAIVTLSKKKFYMLSMASKVLYLDIFCLLYFYYKIVDLHLVSLWQNRIEDNIVELPLFWRELIEDALMVLMIAILFFPLTFKILSAFVLGLYRAKLNKSSFDCLPYYDDAILHFSSAPPHEVNLNGEEYTDYPLPPYSKYPIDPSHRVGSS